MKTIECKTWKEAKVAIEKIRRQHQYGSKGGERCQQIWKNNIVFRGHADANWKLQTTLDRHSDIRWNLWGYLGTAADCLPQIQSIYPAEWTKSDKDEIERFCRQKELGFQPPPMFPYLVYLRHHGFPSPLLDWSTSPMIAAHFAVSNMVRSERMAIYAYCILGKDHEIVGKSNIHLIRAKVATHPRHYLQQAQYTYCTRYDKEQGFQIICPHDDATPSTRSKRVRMYKVTFPTDERLTILHELHDSNITDFSLFQSEEGLVKSLAAQELDLEYDYPANTSSNRKNPNHSDIPSFPPNVIGWHKKERSNRKQ